jgi:hypothetical protein
VSNLIERNLPRKWHTIVGYIRTLNNLTSYITSHYVHTLKKSIFGSITNWFVYSFCSILSYPLHSNRLCHWDVFSWKQGIIRCTGRFLYDIWSQYSSCIFVIHLRSHKILWNIRISRRLLFCCTYCSHFSRKYTFSLPATKTRCFPFALNPIMQFFWQTVAVSNTLG